MKEKSIIDFWENHIYPNYILELEDINNQPIELQILTKGELNSNFGPDFQNVRIKYNNRIYTGDLEFHQYSNDWFRHNHHRDKRYNRVVFHIVNCYDSKIRIINSLHKRIKTFILPKEIINKNRFSVSPKYHYPCYYFLQRENNDLRNLQRMWIKLGIKNINEKIKHIMQFYFYYKNKHWPEEDIFNQLLFVFIFRGMGYYHNRDAFQDKVINIPYRMALPIMEKYLMSQSFKHYGRPSNSPKIRIIQFLHFMKKIKQNPFSFIHELFPISDHFLDFCDKIHILFNQDGEIPKTGQQWIKIIVYNCILLVLYFCYKMSNQREKLDKVIKFLLTSEHFEKNKITKFMYTLLQMDTSKQKFSEISIQGLYYLYKKYCQKKNCENCYFYQRMI